MTILDPTVKLSACPWCKQPGRIITHFDGAVMTDVQAGCKNEKCKVRPRTKKVTLLGVGFDYALKVATEFWEDK